ncbi:T9SS type A sorting domain-containing protein [Hyunsoonleella sp. SJ7]|uniref:T9SS type A sorting domain-containing protein n=1 Tax=Hyunsoonleella aquatilis TaxID=2762758 RepID=A0A923KHK0_9FLAO|nr:T9SS type A sorting domain-containing protein [Hyunsoonleella aquatilis]MBC3756819.1 T9SS type A sorting domain-containing protein [Hyunsoonleella aquatilis]
MKAKIAILLSFLICTAFSHSQVAAFRHYATSANIDGEISVINDVRINGNPDLVVLVENGRTDVVDNTVNNPHFVGVRYNSITGRYYVYNENPAYNMPENSCYNIAVFDENEDNLKHIVDKDNALAEHLTRVLIGQDDPDRRLLYGRTRPEDDGGMTSPVVLDQPIELYYNWLSPGNWYIAVPSTQTMPIGAIFNLATPDGFTVYQHESTFGNIGSEVVAIDDFSYWTCLDHPSLNNNPNAIIFVQHRREPATDFVFRLLSVYYNTAAGKWQVHVELENFISGFSFPTNRLFDVFIYNGALSTDNFTKNEVKAFPNPTDSKWTIQANKIITKVSIFNLLGQKLKVISENHSNSLKIDVSNYRSGHYFAKIEMEGNTKTLKLMKH